MYIIFIKHLICFRVNWQYIEITMYFVLPHSKKKNPRVQSFLKLLLPANSAAIHIMLQEWIYFSFFVYFVCVSNNYIRQTTTP